MLSVNSWCRGGARPPIHQGLSDKHEVGSVDPMRAGVDGTLLQTLALQDSRHNFDLHLQFPALLPFKETILATTVYFDVNCRHGSNLFVLIYDRLR